MNSTVNNDSSVWAGFRRAFYIVAALLAALLLLLWLMGYGPGGSACKAPAAAAMAPAVTPPAIGTPAATTSVAAAPAAVAAAVVAAPATVSAAAPAQAATLAAAPAATPAPAIPGVPAAKVYFAVDKFVLPAGTDKTLAEVVSFLKKADGAKAHVTGFHDPSGSVAHNEELAHNRARAVRGALESAGISRDRIVMDKPSVTKGSGEPREARRVEVRVE